MRRGSLSRYAIQASILFIVAYLWTQFQVGFQLDDPQIRGSAHATSTAVPVFFWQTLFFKSKWPFFDDSDFCGCLSTYNKSMEAQASVHMFHLVDLVGDWKSTPRDKPWLLVNRESPITGRLDPSILPLFDGIISYELHAAFPWMYVNRSHPTLPLQRTMPRVGALWPDQAPIAFIASNCATWNGRSEFVKRLMKFIPVDSYGRCLRNRPWPTTATGGTATPMSAEAVVAHYPFYLALENSDCEGYVTEKYVRAMRAGVVPLVLDLPRGKYERFAAARPGVHIAVNDFPTMAALVAFLRRVLRQPEREWSRFRRNPPSPQFSAQWAGQGHRLFYGREAFCALCSGVRGQQLGRRQWAAITRRWKLRQQTKTTKGGGGAGGEEGGSAAAAAAAELALPPQPLSRCVRGKVLGDLFRGENPPTTASATAVEATNPPTTAVSPTATDESAAPTTGSSNSGSVAGGIVVRPWPSSKPIPSYALTPAKWATSSVVADVKISHQCSPMERYGESGDGGKWLCGVGQLTAPCIIYSLGSNNKFGFEDSMLESTPCQVFTFDCTAPYTRSSTARHKLLRWCVGGKDSVAVPAAGSGASLSPETAAFLTPSTIMSQLGHSTVDLLKMDIEGYEWQVFEVMERTPSFRPRQVSFELHALSPSPHRMLSRQEVAAWYRRLRAMGYAVISKEPNLAFAHCMEVTLFRAAVVPLHFR